MVNRDDDAWQEVCLVAISAQSGTDIKFGSLIDSIDIDLGEKDIEGRPLVNGGRVVKHAPEGDTTVTLEAYPLETGNDDISAAVTGQGFFDLLHGEDTTQPAAITNVRTRTKYRLAIMWTDDTAAVSAAQALTAAINKGIRMTFANGFFTSVKPSFTDGILKFTITFKVVAFNKAGAGQILMESTDGTATLTALQSFTATIKW